MRYNTAVSFLRQEVLFKRIVAYTIDRFDIYVVGSDSFFRFRLVFHKYCMSKKTKQNYIFSLGGIFVITLLITLQTKDYLQS